jgi:DNA-binding XRE family transcriptional regulator
MDLQIITRDGEPEYAVLPWVQYQALLKAAGISDAPVQHTSSSSEAMPVDHPGFDQLGALRAAKGLEVAQLARAVGISPSYLDLIESGERLPDAAIRRSLAWELGVPGWGGDL